ncbi:MAG: hypothetical protein PWQ72_1306, partial [Pseudothermotoga sp.]|nr:hypothetical protein [Pseudothermotoga sp.]
EYEKGVILKALEENSWNVQKTAENLKISIRTLYYRMKMLGIKREGRRT